MEREKAMVEVGRGPEFHLEHTGDFFKYPNGDVKCALYIQVVYRV